MKHIIIGLIFFVLMNLASATQIGSLSPSLAKSSIVSEHVLDLTKRVPESQYINEGFTDNILLALHYFKGDVNSMKNDPSKPVAGNIDWEKVRKDFEFTLELEPGETFAFHENLLPEFKDKMRLSHTNYIYEDGYKTVAGLTGNGVCHLASLMTWVSQESKKEINLEVIANVRHDFYPVNGVPREYGTSIFYIADGGLSSQNQNLYIKNVSKDPIRLIFSANKDKVDFKIAKIK